MRSQLKDTWSVFEDQSRGFLDGEGSVFFAYCFVDEDEVVSLSETTIHATITRCSNDTCSGYHHIR
ncbi:hypothetical protein Bca4012_076919 [Brassica carinata]|uniref:Uncharacterized protein n=1 Tax=Brassica carinata TaxID=52824 RepID=A0A8X7QAD1_BRACI|nr:hypothetical protein Bca52824_072816 [Brassica carinata]